MMMPLGKVLATPIERVLSKVERIPETGCWIFMGAVNDSGYGIVGKGCRGAGNDRAHRITYQYFRGEIPRGIFVCHRCDVPSCCNPDHLFLGTNADNMRDCRSKGRASNPPRNMHLNGENHYAARLSNDNVIEMRNMRLNGATFQEVAEKFNISNGHAYRVVTGLAWKPR